MKSGQRKRVRVEEAPPTNAAVLDEVAQLFEKHFEFRVPPGETWTLPEARLVFSSPAAQQVSTTHARAHGAHLPFNPQFGDCKFHIPLVEVSSFIRQPQLVSPKVILVLPTQVE